MAQERQNFAGLLNLACEKLKQKFELGDPIGETVAGLGSLRAYRLFNSPYGTVAIEVHDEPGAEQPTVWIAVPRSKKYAVYWRYFRNTPKKAPPCNPAQGSKHMPTKKCGESTEFDPQAVPGASPAAYQWWSYQWQPEWNDFRVVTDPSDNGLYNAPYPPPGKAQPVLHGDPWCGGNDEYDAWEAVFKGADPPHWSPVLVQGSLASPLSVQVHKGMQDQAANSSSGFPGNNKLENAAPNNEDLTDRAKKLWLPMTLRGLAVESSFSGHDLGLDHSGAYVSPSGELSTGDVLDGEITDTNNPAMDWDMTIDPDPDVYYLASLARDTVRVELEQFAVPDHFRPHKGDWIQATGRWIVDCGHEHYTEIHPPELLVSSMLPDESSVNSHVVATGAWLGPAHPLRFALYPPPRPHPNAILRWSVDPGPEHVPCDNKPHQDTKKFSKPSAFHVCARPDIVNAELHLSGYPAGNPNHLLGEITTGDTSPIVRNQAGVVGMTAGRRYAGDVRAWWEWPSAAINGTVTSKGSAAKGASVYYRQSDSPPSWFRVPVQEDGSFTLPELWPGKHYFVRPAGSGYDFRKVPAVIQPGTTSNVSFQGSPSPHVALAISSPENLEVARAVALGPFARPSTDRQQATANVGNPNAVNRSIPAVQPSLGSTGAVNQGVYDSLSYKLLTLKLSHEVFGTKDFGAGNTVPEAGSVVVRLAGLDTSKGDAQTELPYWLRVGSTPNNPSRYMIEGEPVQGATVRASLILGNKYVGYQVAGTAEGKTGAQGTVVFDFEAGSHPQDAFVRIQVVSNPYNPWFLPEIRSDDLVFQPAMTGDDLARSSPYQISARLSAGQVVNQTELAVVEGAEENYAFRARWQSWIRSGLPPPDVRQMKPTISVQDESGAVVAATRRAEEKPAASHGKEEPVAGIQRSMRLLPSPVVIEVESLAGNVHTNSGTVVVQEMSAFGPTWSHGRQLFWRPSPPTGLRTSQPRLTLNVGVPQSGRYAVVFFNTVAPDYGNAHIFLDGQPVGDIHGYAPSVSRRQLEVGVLDLTAGVHEFVLTVFSKDSASRGYFLGLDCIQLRPQ